MSSSCRWKGRNSVVVVFRFLITKTYIFSANKNGRSPKPLAKKKTPQLRNPVLRPPARRRRGFLIYPPSWRRAQTATSVQCRGQSGNGGHQRGPEGGLLRAGRCCRPAAPPAGPFERQPGPTAGAAGRASSVGERRESKCVRERERGSAAQVVRTEQPLSLASLFCSGPVPR